MALGIVFFLWGCNSHAVQLLVSLHSLRKQTDLPVAILTPDPAPSPAHMIARDPRLKVTVHHLPLCSGRRNSANCTKTWIHRHTPFDPTLFIDADTLVVGPLGDEVWPEPNKPIWTHWDKWRVHGSPVEARVKRFAEAAGCVERLEKVAGWPAINTGVFAFHKADDVLEPIHELCLRGRGVFIPDECATQLLALDYGHELLDDRWNLSPRHGSPAGWIDARIIHAHGGKVLHRTVREKWLAAFREVWTGDLGAVRMWMPEADRKTYLPLIEVT